MARTENKVTIISNSKNSPKFLGFLALNSCIAGNPMQGSVCQYRNSLYNRKQKKFLRNCVHLC